MTVRGVMAAAMAGLLAGCGHGADSARAEHAAHEQARAGAARDADAAAAVSAADSDMVSAVSASPAAEPVTLRFKLREPPRVGQPLRLELALVQAPRLEIDSILLSLQTSDGLVLESEHSLEFRAPLPGATQRFTVLLRAQQAGLLNLGVTALVDSGSSSIARSFSIPLIIVPAAQ